MPQPANGPSSKKAKYSLQENGQYVFSDAHDIKQALRTTQDQNVLSKALFSLRSKLSLKPGEILVPQDERLNLAKLWMDSSPGAQDLFDVWGTVNDMSTQALVTSLFASLLLLLSYHLPNHSYGVAIIKTVLSPQWIRKLNSYISGSHNELILATLKLFNSISTFGSGRERKAVFEAFPWDNKNLPKLLHMRRRGKESEETDILVRPDIRTYYLLFILSMADQDSASSIKATFLEQRREVFMGIFKGLVQDHYTTIQKVLQVCWEGVWSDPKIKRTVKLALFSETTISHLFKLYDRAAAERPGGEHVPADIVHHFLLAICTHPGQGICFRDRGWYPREADEDSVGDQEDVVSARQKGAHTSKIYNKILANILRMLKVNEDPRQQELALKIAEACPELVAGYWSAAALTLEPRLSSKWIANISFAGLLISQAVPISSFLLPGSSELYNPTPPPLSIIMGNLLPAVGTKAVFTKGLQATSPLVQHCTALVLSKCLGKLGEVMRVLKMVGVALEEDEEEGQWSQQRREVEKEARRRIPEFQVIVGFSQQSSGSSNTTKHALLSESALRLLWLYQECLPDVVGEARFELGKLILNLVEGSLASLSGEREEHEDNLIEQEGQRKQNFVGLQNMKDLHVLRMLSRSDQFSWAGKVASSSRTYFYVLLKTFCNSRVRALRTTLKELLHHVLSESVLFHEDPNEVDMWLTALPFNFVRRGRGTEAPDGAPLTDEVDAVVSFVDDCTQRCLKTPYRYMEAMSALVQSSVSTIDVHRGESFASPLLMTILEQVLAKVSGRLTTPSDTLAVLAFVRRLLVMLAAKQDDPGYYHLLAVLDQLDHGIGAGELFPDFPSVSFGVKREISIARACLRHFQDEGDRHAVEEPSDRTIATFLDRIEQVPIPPSESARITSAFELVDWLRLVDVKPSSADISRIASVVHRLNEPALWAFIYYLHPSNGHLWNPDILKHLRDWPQIDGAFVWMYFHCTLPQLQDRHTCGILLRALYMRPVTLIRLTNAIRLITHDMAICASWHDLTAALLSLLTDMLTRAREYLIEKDLRRLKETVMECNAIQDLCLSQNLAAQVHDALQEFVSASFDPMDNKDRVLLSSIGSHCAQMLPKLLELGQYNELQSLRPWVKFMSAEDLLATIDLMEGGFGHNEITLALLEDILGAFQERMPRGSASTISVSKLIKLQAVLPASTLLEDILSAALVSRLTCGFDGRITFNEGEPLSTVLSRTKMTTQIEDLRPLPFDFIHQLLKRDSWTESTRTTMTALLYSNPASLQTYAMWLDSKRWTRLSTHIFGPVLAAFLECTALTGRNLSGVKDDLLHGLLRHLFSHERSESPLHTRAVECICRILELSGARSTGLAATLQDHIQGIPLVGSQFETTFLARKLVGVPGCDALVASIADRALQWAVRHLSDDAPDSEDSSMAVENLRHIVAQQRVLKAHLVEPLMTVLVRRHLPDVGMLELAVSLASKTPLKPVVVNRLLQNILQHQQFITVCGKHGSPSQRNQLTRLLDTLFRLHPANTCQSSHVEPLLHVYGGTLSSPDRQLLSIMRLFETEKRISLFAFFSQWSPSPDTTASNVLEVVQNFDPVYMLRTCLAFPAWRRFGEETGAREGPTDKSMYDPLMAIVVTAQMLVQCPPANPLGWVKVFRSNVVSLLVRCLSSKDPNIRETALSQIASVWESMQRSEMHEAPQVLYVFRLLKNVMHPPTNAGDPPRRLPTFTTLILLHALRGIFYPSNFIYPRTARFLLQRPELDVSDVPMLFGMLYSSSDDWKKERGWMLRLLGDGMVSTDDWKVLKRRHTWDLVASLFQSAKHDTAVRTGILEMLANMTCNAQACTSLVLKSSLLSWIEMQVEDAPNRETMAWLRVLENVLLVADVSKLSRAMGDQWVSTLCRCLCAILRRKDKEMAVLQQAATVVLRLGLVPDVPAHALRNVLLRAVEHLEYFEPGIRLHRLPWVVVRDALALPPHRAQGLLEIPTIAEPLQTWGTIVESLWRASMGVADGTCAWATVTRRLLIWRALAGEERSPVGEWARREVVRALATAA